MLSSINSPSTPGPRGADRWGMLVQLVRFGGTALLLASVACFVAISWHWRVVNDAALMHYTVLLQQHGFAPYRAVHDINLAGAYLPDWIAMTLAGAHADLAWRLYDLVLLLAATAAMVVVALPYDWFAGIFAGVLLALLHGRDGIGQAGQRDLAIAVLLLCATAALMAARRRWRAAGTSSRLHGRALGLHLLLFAGLGLALGLATTIKPFGIAYFGVSLAWVLVALRRDRRAARAAALASSAGFLLPLAATVLYLLRQRALGSFLSMCRVTLPFHASLIHPPFAAMIREAAPPSFLQLAVFAGLLMFLRATWRELEVRALLAALAVGLVFFFLQHKDYSYQRYPYLAFLLLWVALECTSALRDRRPLVRALGMAGLLFGIFGTAPSCLRAAYRAQWQEPYLRAMEADLNAAGGSALSGRVQCIDSISGCVNVLYRMRLVQATGTLYDEFLFPPAGNDSTPPAVIEGQQTFLRELAQRPPQVFIVSAWLFADGPGDYAKLARWPAFRDYLDRNYRLADQQSFPRAENGPMGFRMYVRRP